MYNGIMVLKPQDVVVALRLALASGDCPSYAALASQLHMSVSEVHAAVARAQKAHIVDSKRSVNRRALLEFLIHGVRYAYPAVRGAMTRGVPTAYAAPPLRDEIAQPDEPPPVWPYADGSVRGYALAPLMKSAPDAAANDGNLYELLALVDAIRDGRARERKLAGRFLTRRLGSAGSRG